MSISCRLFAAALFLTASAASAADAPFAGGWVLDPTASELRVTSIKKGNLAETSTFASFGGTIEEDGAAEIRIQMESIDTKIDLRNVRMRFLFFESFKFPEAVIATRISPAAIADLAQTRRKAVDLSYALTIRGITAQRTDRVMLTLMDDNTVAVATAGPIYIKLSDFDLENGRQKLQEAANVDIVPLGTVTFDFLFRRKNATGVTLVKATDSGPLEPKGDFDAAACIGRFEILSRTGNIYFGSGSATLQSESTPLLQTLLDIVQRCPEMRIQVAGHTDSDGPDAVNQALSEARAKAVMDYLAANGVNLARIRSVGFGESRPVVPNDSRANKSRNRRIEFSVIDG